MLYLSLFLFGLVSCQETTEDPHHTVTYNPGQDCLPFDGSVVPDCSKFIDPVTKQPYYHEHSSSKLLIWLLEDLTLTSHLSQTAAGSGSAALQGRLVCSSVLLARQR